ncbi:MAG: hypothetical protein ABSC30_15655 [Acidimicrobiales bacterium]
MNQRVPWAAGVVVVGIALAGCGSGSGGSSAGPTSSPTTSPKSSPTTTPSATSAPPENTPTTGAVATGASTCPTLAQADTALGVSFGNLVQSATAGGGIVCEYTGGAAGNAGVTIFAHQSASVFAGQVAHAPGAPAMPAISGVGDGAFGTTTAGRSIVNAYSNGSRTLVAAQAPGALAPVEALARVALADN